MGDDLLHEIPHLHTENKSIGDALKASKTTFFDTWGENIVSGLGIGAIAFLFAIPIIGLTIGLSIVAGPFGLLVGAVLIGLLIAWANAAEQVAVVALVPLRQATRKCHRFTRTKA